MEYNTGEGMAGHEISRREFLQITALSGAGFVIGCAANPVTGKSQLMLISEDTEIKIDRQNSPHQFSADYGTVQDGTLNNYLEQTGKALTSRTHRSHMPYSFTAVNATYINAYTFPGGSVAATRGILLAFFAGKPYRRLAPLLNGYTAGRADSHQDLGGRK